MFFGRFNPARNNNEKRKEVTNKMMKINPHILEKMKTDIPNPQGLQKITLKNLNEIDNGKESGMLGDTLYYQGKEYYWEDFMTLSRLNKELIKKIFSISLPLCPLGQFKTECGNKNYFSRWENLKTNSPIHISSYKGISEITKICLKNNIRLEEGIHKLCDLEKEVEGILVPLTWDYSYADRDRYVETPQVLFIPSDEKLFFMPEYSARVGTSKHEGPDYKDCYPGHYVELKTITRKTVYELIPHYLCQKHTSRMIESQGKGNKENTKNKFSRLGDPTCIYDPKWVEQKL